MILKPVTHRVCGKGPVEAVDVRLGGVSLFCHACKRVIPTSEIQGHTPNKAYAHLLYRSGPGLALKRKKAR